MRSRFLPLFPLLFGVSTIVAQVGANAPVEIRVPIAPTPVTAGGRTLLGYEIHITNFQARDLALDRIDVFGPAPASPPLASYQGDALEAAITRIGGPAAASGKRTIAGGMRAVVYMWLTFAKPDAVPRVLQHRFSFTVTGADGKKEARSMDAASVAIAQTPPVVISAPFKGGTWVAANGPSNTSEHRRALIPVGGLARIAQRFAIDWLKLNEEGKAWHGDLKSNANWYGYGVEVLAVADAVVAAVKDGIPENVPTSQARAVPITLETIGGNHVILALPDGRFAFYAHLQPGSLRVKTGDRVRRGQALGLLGNSGNSDAPHLHLHIVDANSPLESEGLPFLFESFEVLGTADLDEMLEKGWKPPVNHPPDRRVREMPVENAVVRFN